VEQLDLAAELLQASRPTQSRLALILVDNAAEYILHKYAVNYFRFNPVSGGLPVEKRREQYKERAKVRAQRLKPKITFALSRNAITEDQGRFVREAHKLRNQAYHAGLAHDPIITELAMAYYSLVCQILPDLAPRMVSVKFDTSFSPRVQHHISREARLRLPAKEGVDLIVGSLKRIIPQPKHTLAEACGSSLVGRMDEVRSLIDYLVQNDPTAKSAEHLILNTQFWTDFWARAPEEGLTLCDTGSGRVKVDPRQKKQWKKATNHMRTSWRPKVSMETFGRWDRRISRLTSESMPGALLQKYRKLESDLEPFEKMISRRCAAYDQNIDELLEEERLSDL
jgi:hypothetical protein